ncbi:MAG TPA: DEAD/DEAH box helicase [Caldisericia bacterium]|nr:DEAD/DEAH box helicase [Caldisericia bacterium]
MIELKSFYKEVLNINEPHSRQIELWNAFKENRFPIIIKAPTGSGKTEAIIAPFLYQFLEKDFHVAPRMIYVLPMRVLVNNVVERIKKCACMVSPYISVIISLKTAGAKEEVQSEGQDY